MGKLTFEEIKNRGLLLFEYVRGSKLYHTDTPDSDIDVGGVFISPPDFDFELVEEVADQRNDQKWWELGKFMQMAMTSNPAVLEAFFIPDELVLYEHPLFKEIRKHGKEFVTKACFKPFGSYAVQQIAKAQGQNKKIHWDVTQMKRKTPLDFCYTFDGRQGSVCIKDWLDEHGLRQDCCGLVNLQNMKDCYLMYYDFAQHFRLENTDFETERKNNSDFFRFMMKHFENQIIERRQKADNILSVFYNKLNEQYESLSEKEEIINEEINIISNQYPEKYIDILEPAAIYMYVQEKTSKPFGGHCGIINNEGTSNTVRLCSTDKDETPICMMTHNADGYGTHCKKYKEYEEWKQKRNKARYESNLKGEQSGNPDMQYDVKNMYHSLRNVAMCTEIAKGQGLILDRTGIDRDFLMDVRARKFGYSELMEKLKTMTEEMQKACEESTIPEKIDEKMVSRLTIETRVKFFENYFNKTINNKKLLEECREHRVKEMLFVFDELLTILKVRKEDVMLTGSVALYKHGLLSGNKTPKDIDAVIKCSKSKDTESLIKAITILNGGNTYWKQDEKVWKGVEHKPYIFIYEGVEFNIWVQNSDTEFDSEITCKEGYHLATVKHILDAKKYYGRLKDAADIIEMSVDLLSGLGRKPTNDEENSNY